MTAVLIPILDVEAIRLTNHTSGVNRGDNVAAALHNNGIRNDSYISCYKYALVLGLNIF